MNIILIGFMGTGKSSIGRKLAAKTGFRYIDTDSMIEEREAMPISEIFRSKGEKYFRDMEANTIAQISGYDNYVISTGGGVVLSLQNLVNLRNNGTLISLSARPEIILQRTQKQNNRPLLNVKDPAAEIEKRLEERAGLYRGDLMLDTSDISQDDAVNRIMAFINRQQVQPYTLAVKPGAASYDIHIGSNMLQNLDLLLGKDFSGTNTMVITNPKVYELWGHSLENGLGKLTDKYSVALVPDGEEYKSLASAEELYDKALNQKLDRKSLIIAFGGGVIGDLAGYVASTYMRGVPFVQIPTTLLAQVDSSVGGKVAVNHRKGKNLIGSFYQPKMVISDISTLLTLPKRELSNGLAEVVKYGMIKDPCLFGYLEHNIHKVFEYDLETLMEIIKASCRIKAEFVALDEKENGIRALLNYGHTIGHGIEASTDYELFRHGEAVSIGMTGAAHLAVGHGLLSEADYRRQSRLLEKAYLPVAFADMNIKKVLDAAKADKKNENGRLRLIIPKQIGAAEIVENISIHDMECVLSNLKG